MKNSDDMYATFSVVERLVIATFSGLLNLVTNLQTEMLVLLAKKLHCRIT